MKRVLFNFEQVIELAKAYQKYHDTDDAVIRYIESRKVKGWLYEPHFLIRILGR